jgi:peptidoglycan/LPS O-acetylase OafA/YrhL
LTAVFNGFAWFACLAILGAAQRWLNGNGRFWQLLQRNGFGLYVFHYPLLTLLAYLLVSYFPALGNPALYLILLVAVFPLTIAFTALIRRTPILRTLLLGIKARR